VLFNLWDGIRTSADKQILSRGWQTLCKRESSKNYQHQRPWESKVREFELWADSTCEKSWRRIYFERTRERERGNSAVKSCHLKVRKASLQRFISRD